MVGGVVPSGVGGWMLRPEAEGCPPSSPTPPALSGQGLPPPWDGFCHPRVYVCTKEALVSDSTHIPFTVDSGTAGPRPCGPPGLELRRSSKGGGPVSCARTSGVTSGVTPGLGQDPHPLQGLRTFPDPEARPVLVPEPELVRAEVPS